MEPGDVFSMRCPRLMVPRGAFKARTSAIFTFISCPEVTEDGYPSGNILLPRKPELGGILPVALRSDTLSPAIGISATRASFLHRAPGTPPTSLRTLIDWPGRRTSNARRRAGWTSGTGCHFTRAARAGRQDARRLCAARVGSDHLACRLHRCAPRHPRARAHRRGALAAVPPRASRRMGRRYSRRPDSVKTPGALGQPERQFLCSVKEISRGDRESPVMPVSRFPARTKILPPLRQEVEGNRQMKGHVGNSHGMPALGGLSPGPDHGDKGGERSVLAAAQIGNPGNKGRGRLPQEMRASRRLGDQDGS